MKAYERQVFWLDYFNSELKRNQGRRVPLDSATKAPTLWELEEACRRLGLQPIPQKASFPNASSFGSGYVSVKKSKPKHALVEKIAAELSIVRGESTRREGQSKTGQKK